MAGIFPAIVLGDGGEEIHADPLGRVKVRLMFDHRKDTVAGMAVWVRVIQPWAGNTWGWQHLPRVGTEAAVAFMSGDPDNPVIVGGVYNEVMQPVFPVPSEQTKSGMRSRSTLQGGTQDYSEFSIDDKKGQELVLLHAQKDHKIEVEHDQNATIGNDRTVTTRRNDSLTSETGEITITAAKSITLRVGTSIIEMTPESILIEATVHRRGGRQRHPADADILCRAPDPAGGLTPSPAKLRAPYGSAGSEHFHGEGEDIADAAFRQDDPRNAGLRLQFPPQPQDLHVDRPIDHILMDAGRMLKLFA